MGLEIADQVQNIDAVVIPVGGAGLLAGCAVALKTLCPNIMVIVSDFCFFLRQAWPPRREKVRELEIF